MSKTGRASQRKPKPMKDFVFGADLGDYRNGMRQLREWHMRPGFVGRKVKAKEISKDEGIRRARADGSVIEIRGSGFMSGSTKW